MIAKHNLNKRHAGTYGTEKFFVREWRVLIDQVIHRLLCCERWRRHVGT